MARRSRRSHRPRPLASLGAVLVLGACAFVNPGAVPRGSSAEQVIERLGPPTGSFALPDGARRLEYARGPFGKQTWMFDFDARGGLAEVSQVLTEKRFNQVRAGLSIDELRLALGRPSETGQVGWQDQIVWSYRYESPFCQWFQVGIDRQGRVVDTGYAPDPACDDREAFFFPRRHR